VKPVNLTLNAAFGRLFYLRFVRAFLAVMVIFLCGCSSSWTRGDTVRQGAFVALASADWRQTRTIADNPDRWYECNPVIGKHPTKSQVNRYFAATIIGHTMIAALLPKQWRSAWQYLGIGAEGAVVYLNWGEGIR